MHDLKWWSLALGDDTRVFEYHSEEQYESEVVSPHSSVM